MKPALSVILLTTLIGAGQGLFLAQFSAHVLALLTLLPTTDNTAEFTTGGVLSFSLLAAGLMASFFHLGHPERAWRAAAMWRTSWLSREVIALPIVMGSILIYTAVIYADPKAVAITLSNGVDVPLHTLIGGFTAIAIIGLFVCTSMIYACLKFLRQWHSPLTVCNFFLLGSASGCTLACVVAAFLSSQYTGFYTGSAILFTLLAGISRWATLIRNKNLRHTTTLQSATGIHHPTIRQMAQGAMGGSFNTRTFIHTYSTTIIKLARRFFLITVFVFPVILLVLSLKQSFFWLFMIVYIVQYVGLLVERWYFFIEADHPQNVYYQSIS